MGKNNDERIWVVREHFRYKMPVGIYYNTVLVSAKSYKQAVQKFYWILGFSI